MQILVSQLGSPTTLMTAVELNLVLSSHVQMRHRVVLTGLSWNIRSHESLVIEFYEI